MKFLLYSNKHQDCYIKTGKIDVVNVAFIRADGPSDMSYGRSELRLYGRTVRRTVPSCEHFCPVRCPVRESRACTIFLDTTLDPTPDTYV
jgi:hypothetical protein